MTLNDEELFYDRHSVDAAQRCNLLGAEVAFDRADKLNMPLDLTLETRRILDDIALPAMFLLDAGEAEGVVTNELCAYEGKLDRRRMRSAVAQGGSYYDRFLAESALIRAVSYAASIALKGTYVAAETTNREHYRSGPALLKHVGTDAEPRLTLHLFRTVSRWDNNQRAKLDIPAVLTWLRLTVIDEPVTITIQPVVVGSVGKKDTCYEMPFTRRWYDRVTNQHAWRSSYVDAGGQNRRLGKGWGKQVLTPPGTKEWIDKLAERADHEPFRAVFPDPITFVPTPAMVGAAERFLENLVRNPLVRNTRGCLFPNECPMFARCWGEEV